MAGIGHAVVIPFPVFSSSLSSSSTSSLKICSCPFPAPSLSCSSNLSGVSAGTIRFAAGKHHRKALRTATSAVSVVSALGKLSETEFLPFTPETGRFDGTLPSGSGIYGVYDGKGDLQFIGISRNIAASILAHRKSVPDLCCSVKVGSMDEADRTVLTDAWKSWMQEHIEATGKIPPGNESRNNTWVRVQQKKPNLRLTPGRHVQLTVPLEELIDQLVRENKVVAFIKGSRSAPQCGFSQKVIGLLESHGADFECVDVLDEEYNSGLRETLKKYSNWPTFPQVFVRGELVGGCDILSAMEEKGELAALLQK